MKTDTHLKSRQGGALAVMAGISIVVLVGFLALVLDLGHVYIAKTELQNAADAAALAGAKELNGRLSGVTSAVAKAQEIAAQNRYDFSRPVDITIANISVGNCPDSACMVSASSVTDDIAAGNKYFIRVDTGPRPFKTWVAPIFNMLTGGSYANTNTFGMAVAGRYLVDITPLAMCAVDLSKCPAPVGSCTTPPCECGYERGKSYKVSDMNPIGPGTLYWLDPTATTANCTITSANEMRPFVCQGKASVATTTGSHVYTNTGVSVGPLLGALDSRFNEYPSASQCDPATAPPDSNIMEYRFDDPAVSAWMNPAPTQQAAGVTSRTETLITTDSEGVVWSFSRPEGNPIATRSVNTPPYPASPLTPYTDGTFTTPPSGGGAAFMKANRRAMNLVVVACESAGGVCREVPVAGIGKFLLMRKSNFPTDMEIYVEFGEFIPNGPNTTEYLLYR